MKQYVWCEDRGAGYTFWTKLFAVWNPAMIVQSKGNNTGLRKAASQIENDGNEYYILIDHAVDNPDVLREVKKLNLSVRGKENVTIIRIHSFELVLLSFRKLEDWIFASVDELKEKRRYLLNAGKILVQVMLCGGNSEQLSRLKSELGFADRLNSEQISAKLLFEITRNTGFETDKGHLGECFLNSCCDWNERQSDDICGLDANRLSSKEKVSQLIEDSMLKEVLFVEG